MSLSAFIEAFTRAFAARSVGSGAGLTVNIFLAALLVVALAAHPPAASARRQDSRRQQEAVTASAESDEEKGEEGEKREEGESESVGFGAGARTRPRVVDPVSIMRTAKTVFVNSKTAFVKHSEVENALRKRPEFQAWGMSLTRDEGQADLVIEIERKSFTKRFVFTVIEPRSLTVVTSGKARSIIFGDTIAHKVAEKFVSRFKAVRPFNKP